MLNYFLRCIICAREKWQKNHSIQVCLIFFSLYIHAPSWCWRQFKLTWGKTSINSDIHKFWIFFQKKIIFLHYSVRQTKYQKINWIWRLGTIYVKKNGEYFADKRRHTQCAKRTPSVLCGHSSGCAPSPFTKAFFIVLLSLSTRPFDWEWYAEVIRYSTPARSCQQVHKPLTNSLP